MKKIMNKAEDFVFECMEGIKMAYPDKLKFIDDELRVVMNAQKTVPGKVGIVTAGGSGHLPVFMGYVGSGLLDGCAIGNVFASPSASKMTEMILQADQGNGVLCLYGNYGGDKLNFELACENADFEDVKTKQLLVRDDIASSPVENADKRRGVAGMVYAFKIAGAAADAGCSLDEVYDVTKHALDNIRTIGVALSPCIVPEVGKPTFEISDNQIEIGMGIHGEPGIDVTDMKSADEIAEIALEMFDKEIELKPGDKVSIMVNGLGATPREELYIVYRAIAKTLGAKSVEIVVPHVDEYATSMEMAGLSITIFKLDDELEKLLKAPAASPFYTNHHLI